MNTLILQAPPQLQMFAKNIAFLIGILFAGALLFVLGMAGWTGLKIVLAIVRQRRSMEQYRRETRRADGRMYPPAMEGQCEGCKRRNATIYHPDDGPLLCADCYEPYWRQAEGWIADDEHLSETGT